MPSACRESTQRHWRESPASSLGPPASGACHPKPVQLASREAPSWGMFVLILSNGSSLIARLMSPGWAATQGWGLCFPATFHFHILPLKSLPPVAPTRTLSLPVNSSCKVASVGERALDWESGDLGSATILLHDLKSVPRPLWTSVCPVAMQGD